MIEKYISYVFIYSVKTDYQVLCYHNHTFSQNDTVSVNTRLELDLISTSRKGLSQDGLYALKQRFKQNKQL